MDAAAWVFDAVAVVSEPFTIAYGMNRLTDTLVIAVDERRMLAVWQHAGRTAVIDVDGQVVGEADPGRFANLPLIVGQGANAAASSILPSIAARPRLAAKL